jgi:hypothetical protein
MAGTNIPELFGGKWSGTTITYSFISAFPDYYAAADKAAVGNPGSLSSAQQQVIVGILNYIQTVTGITFVAVDPASGQVGNITFGTASNVAVDRSGFTFSQIGQAGVGGDVWFKEDLVPSVFANTALHEIGHALGLKHPNDNDVFPQGPFLSSDENFYSYTVMTSREQNNNYRNVPDPSTFMLYDIAELQFLYGASNANAGNDTYAFGGASVRTTIWDTGGTDTISAAGASRSAVINLNETKFSSIINNSDFSLSNPARNIAIAQGVTIEKAIGTAQADIIVGNKVKNDLDGGAGNDLIFGDEVVAKKILTDGDNYRGVFIDDLFWFKGTYQIDGSTDANDDDTISGGTGLDWIYGGAGNDILNGGAGNDYLDGGAGTDTALYDDATSAQTLELHKGDAPDGVRTDGTVPVAEEKFLAISRGSETDTLRSIEKIKLSDQADTLKIRAGTDLKALKQIDGGSNPSGTPDVVDLSLYDGKLQLKNGHLTGDEIDIQLDNFEKLVGTTSGDTFDLNNGTITWADGGAGNDILTGGTAQSILTGGDGTDQLFAGKGGATLDGGVSKGQGDSYVGGAGADTFVIGNGTHVKQGTDAKFNISSAGTNDRLVLRLANTVGLTNESALTQGIVLSGGIQSLIWTNDGVLLTPHTPDSNHVQAVFSSVLVQPTGVTSDSSSGHPSATINGRTLDDARPEVGNFIAYYDWDKSAATLDIKITTAYGDFAVHVDNYQSGQLGLNFVDKNEPIDGLTLFSGDAAGLLQGSWDGYNDAMRSLVQGAQIVDVPSPGKAEDGDADPVSPTSPKKGYLPDFASSFDPGAGSQFGGSGTSDPNDPNNGNNPKRAPFLDNNKNPLKKDPLVLDLSGNGLHLTAGSLSDTYVDFTGTGFANRTGWVDAQEGILINYTGSTAMGPNTILGATSGDGFADLAALDSNGDGQVDASDSAAASLRVWVDDNGDGRIGADEVFTLADAGVSSIGLQATASGQLMNENTITATGSFVRSDATTGDLFEVNFATDPVLTQAIIPDGFEYSPVALDLPGLDGYGHVADLRYDMTVDSSLRNEALQLVLNSGGMTGSQFDAAFEHLVQSWAGAATLDPSSRGPLIDARHMAVVEAFYGQTFAQVNGAGAVLDAIDAANIEQAYGSILDAMKIRFAVQIKDSAIANGETATDAANNPLAAFATLDYTAATDVVSLNLAQLAASIANAIPSDPARREAYVDLIARATRALRVDFYAEDPARLAAGFDAAVATASLALGSRLQLAAEITAVSIIDATGQGSTVTGTSSNEVILAGAGNQTLAGGGGADVYIYSAAADGNDTIQAGGSQSGLILTDLARSDVTFSRSGEDVLIAIASTGKTITIAGQLNGQGAGTLQTIKFSDGTSLSSWDIAGVVNPANEFDGTSGADNLVSPGYSNETYDLGAGDDHLFDRNVNGNTFVYRSGDGNDTYDVSSQQTPTSILKLLGLNAADITATRFHGDLLVKVNATNEIVTITGQFTDSHNGIATIHFADGTSWDRAAINAVPDTTPAAVYSISGHPSVNDGATLEFTVNRTADNTTSSVTVSYSLGGTAVAGTDYTSPAGSVTFAPGELSKVIDIQTIGQANPAPDKSVVVTLASLNGSAGTISGTAASSDGTIIESGASLAITSQLLANDTGRSQSDFITQDGHVSLKGTTPTGATVLIFDGGLSLGSAAISGTNWTFSTNLSEGTHQLHAVAIDGSGVIATASAAPKIVVDNTAPNPWLTDVRWENVAGRNHLIYLGVSEAGSLVQNSYIGISDPSISGVWDIPTDASGNWKFDVYAFGDTLPPGSWTYDFITATDAAGNETPSLKGRFGLASVHGYSLTGTNTGPNYFSVVAGGSITFGNSSGGGNGKNTVVFAPDAGYSTDINVNGGSGNVLLAAGMQRSDIYFQANTFGDLFIRFRDSDSYIDAHNALQTASWGVTSAITSIGSDSWRIPLGQAALGQGDPLTFTWLGTGNNYFLTGSNYGSNVFEITAGSGTINFGNSNQGGDGTNTVKYARGDATADINLNGGTGVIAFAAGIAAQDVYWQSNNFGDLTLRIRGDATDSIVVHGDLVDQAGTVTSSIGQLQFSDGASIDLVQPLTFTWLGTGNNYFLTGSNYGSNVFEITAGSGTINFGNSSKGGDGTNTVMYARGDATADINLNGGTGVIAFAPGIAAQDVYWQANTFGDLTLRIRDDATDSIVIHGDLVNQAGTITSGVHQLQFSNGSSIDLAQPLTFTWLGTGNNYFLTGSNFGSNVFEITAGSGTINFGNSSQGGDGTNTVMYARGDATADINPNGGTGVIAFAPGIAAQDVYWQSNNFGDLTLRIRGDATDSIIVHGDLVDQAGTVTSSIRQLQFDDGSSMNLVQPLTFTWLGTGNNYFLTGSNYGSNVFEITAGSGTINFGNSSKGGDGTNTINYILGDATANVNLNGGTGTIAFGAGISAQDVYWQSNGFGDLTVKIRGDATDSIFVSGDLVDQGGSVTSGIHQLQFSDGSSIDLVQPLTFTWLGTGNNYFLTGSNYGSNVFEITAGSGTINFGNSSKGGDGTNTINYILGDATANVNLNGGTGTIAFGAGISAQDVYWQSNGFGDLTVKIRGDATDSIFVSGDLVNQAGSVTSGIRQLQFSDGSSIDLVQPLTFTWLGTSNNYFLTGSNYGSNVFEITAGSGNVTFGNSNSGGSGTNVVKYNQGTGRLDIGLNGGTGTLQMGSGLTAADVSFQSNSSGDLIVNINGDATDTVIIHGDYATVNGTLTSGISQIQFGDGSSISALSLDFVAPTVSSVTASGIGITSGDGAVGLGSVVTLTVNFSENVVVSTTGGTPTLSLNDGGVATYIGGTGTSALTFSYTVAAGQSTSDLTVTGLNLNGGTIADAAANAAVLSGATTNPAGTLQIDTSVPTVSSVTTSPASGTAIIGSVVTLTVNFSENVAVNTTGGTPTLTLSDGGTATYTGGSGTGALTFSHTVAAGQSTADLTVTALSLNGGTIADLAGNTAVVTGAVTNPAGVLVVDGIAPTVNSIATSGTGIASGTGVLNAGKVVTLTVNFSENVVVTTTGGTPTLTLDDGGTATYASGSGSSALAFNYTVAAGQNTPDLTVTALNLNGGTIKDTAGNTAVVTGAATNPAGTLQIDTAASTVNFVATSGAGITSGSGTVGVGSVVTLTVNFSENVVVTTTGGTPTLTLNDGGTATYVSGSGTNALAFNYTVAAGQNTSDLTVSALNLNGGTIADAAGNAAVVTGAVTNPAGTLQIDTSAPTVSSVTTSPASGSAIIGSVVTLTVNFSESVVVTTTGGTPTLTLNDGGTATYTGGSGTGALAFSYTVAAGQNTADLTVTALNLNGGTIKDGAGNAAVVTGAATNPAGILLIDGTAPTVSSVTTSPASGTVIAGGVVTLTVNFSENVAVNTTGGTPTLTLSDGGAATYTGGSGTGALTFSHTVAAGQGTADLTVTALNLNGGTIKDVAGNTAIVTGAVTNPAGVLVIDGVAPTVNSVAASGTGITSGSGVLNAGKVVTLTANFSENVTVVTTGGTPTLTLNDGGVATYASGSGTSALAFTYTVAAGQNTPDLTVTALNLNGGTIKDAAGNAAVVTGAATNPAGTLQIDTTASTVSSVATSGTGITSGSGTVGVGTVVTLTVNFNESVVVTTTGGTPTLTLNDGGVATYTGGTGTSALTFNYTVAAGQSTADLTVTALNLNGGTIKDVAGNTAVVTGAATNPAGILLVDGTAPTVSSVTTSPGSGSVILGGVVTLTVNFSESVVVSTTGGTPTLTLNDGGTATYTGGSGTGALAFSYTVAAGQNTSDLTVTALNLNGGTIKDTAGNAAVVTGAVTNPAGVLLIDGTVPTATSIAATGTGITSGNGILNAGKVVTLKATLSEAVTVTTTGGTPSLALSDGGVATYTSGSGTTALTFTHTVAAGQNTPDLTVTGLNLNGGTVKDAAGNTAVITGNPAGTLQIDTTSPGVNSVATSGTGITAGTGVLNAGKVVTLTVNFSENVTVVTTGGTPTLTLNDGGTATYTGGTGTSALTFNYTVAAGQNTPDLTVTALNLNGGTIKDAAGNTAVVTGAATNPAGTLQIDTAASTVSSVATSGTGITSGSGVLNAGKVVTLTVNFNEAVVVTTTGGTPTLTLNDAGVATYTGGTGTSALTFNYTVAAGQNTADLTVTALNLNGGTIKDVAGNTAVVTGAVTNPAGTLQIDTTASTVSSVVTSGPGITAGSGNLGVGAVVTLTVNFNEAQVVTTTGGTPTLTLNDGGVATYTGGSGTTAQAFSYTVAAGQNTPDLTVTALNLNGGTIKDVAGNTSVVTGAVTNPAGTLQITTSAGFMASLPASQSFAGAGSTPNIYTLSPTGSATITPDYSSGMTNEFDFAGNVTDQNLWFLQSGNNLQIDVIGTTNQTTINGWFNSGNQASEEFTAGGLRLDNQISQLVQAMAAYSGSHAGFDPMASTVHQIPNDAALQNTVAAAWHA